MNPSRPNDNLEGEAKCYSPTLQSKGSGLFFLGSLIHTGDEISTERRDRDNGRECQRWSAGSVKPTLVCVGFQPYPAETHSRYLSLAAYRERSGRNTTYSGRFSLPLSFSVASRCAWVTDLSSSRSFSVVVRISLSAFFLLCRRSAYEPIETSNIKKLIHTILISFNIKKIINIKNNRNR